MSAHATLRAATRSAHDRVDAAFSSFDLADPVAYRNFLLGHAAAFLPAEQALTDAGAGRLIDDWDRCRRSAALIADLTALGVAPPAGRTPPMFGDPASIYGGIYVLEGSRLGGAMLRRSVGAGLPRAFLDCVQPRGRWRRIIAQMEGALYDQRQIERATATALETFAMFESRELGRAA